MFRSTRRQILRAGLIGAAALTTGSYVYNRLSRPAIAYADGGPDFGDTIGPYQYNGGQAAQFADQYALSYANGYIDIAYNGDDCANFVSTCLNAGGLPMSNQWYVTTVTEYRWFIIPEEVNVTDPNHNWSVAINLYNYLLYGNGNFGTLVGKTTAADQSLSSGLNPGDVLFYDWGQKGGQNGRSHTAILTFPGVPSDGSSPNSMDLVDQHSNDFQGIQWTQAPQLINLYGADYLNQVTIYKVSINISNYTGGIVKADKLRT